MANKEQVLTEDSPGTVDALAKGSDHFDGVWIEGGVDLASTGRYVFDAEVTTALAKVMSRLPAHAPGNSALSSQQSIQQAAAAAPFSFNVGKGDYTVVPYHTLTSGKDRRGIRYQTDVALRQGDQPGLEIVRYFNPAKAGKGEFGEGWRLLVPYRIRPADDVKREFLNAVIPEKMVVENMVSDDEETLSFSTDRYSIAGYVPDQISASQVVGLFIMSDASFRLADKLGNEFWFNQAGHLTDLIFSEEHRVHLDYLQEVPHAAERLRLKLGSGKRSRLLDAVVPGRIRVVEIASGDSEVLTFSDTGPIAAYRPSGKSRFEILAPMSDGSFVLLDKRGHQVSFDRAGGQTGFTASARNPVVSTMSLGDTRVTFEYELDAAGAPRIAKAKLQGKEQGLPEAELVYQYDGGGRLARVIGPAATLADASPPVRRPIALAGGSQAPLLDRQTAEGL